ncbi:hypothetical protein H8N03_08190 [Ramlibacter sp. USB13]|uniref:Cell envelope biogenesis protein TolA n=1 Tax=Ramlibacter cellulosilyticus TaxID=2764187 RepID=A0A923SB65_9BURK|nr:hypothetical protein [Ramlibacter cellulosilyticus]MBC5782923.1 hypothetical protein [Ramlibacter cellulosilyticus]
MIKIILTTAAASLALLASGVYAQSDTAGESRAAPAKSATKAEKESAKAKRRATSKEIAQGKGSTTSDNTVKEGKTATAAEKSAAKSKRKTEGAAAAKTGSAGGEAKQ